MGSQETRTRFSLLLKQQKASAKSSILSLISPIVERRKKMNRWMKGLSLGPRDKEQEPGEQGGGGNGTPSDPNPEGEEGKNLPPTGTGAESPFKDGPLKGKSLQEVEAEFSVLNLTLGEQSQQLTEQHERLNQPPAPAIDDGGVDASPPKATSEDYFTDPVGVTTDIVKSVLVEHLDKIIKPFEASLASDQTSAAWVEAVRRYPDIENRRTLIQAQFDRGAVKNPNADSIVYVYKHVLGELALTNTQQPSPQPNAQPEPRPAPPQHSASSQPLSPQSGEKQLRELTENEHTLRRMRGQSVETYLSFQEMPEEDVIDSKVGIPS